MTLESNIVPIQDSLELNAEATEWPRYNQTGLQSHSQSNAQPSALSSKTADHFIVRNGIEFAGTHIIVDLWGASNLDDIDLMERTLREAIDVSGATLLHIHLHHFTPNEGISGVAVLAESHISVHTWPERNFAAFDVFMCGDAEPDKVIPVLQAAFTPSNTNVSEHLRGAKVLQQEVNEKASLVEAPIMNEANDETL